MRTLCAAAAAGAAAAAAAAVAQAAPHAAGPSFAASMASVVSGAGVGAPWPPAQATPRPAGRANLVAAAVAGAGASGRRQRRRLQAAAGSAATAGGGGFAGSTTESLLVHQATETAETLLSGLQVTTLPGLIDSIPFVGNMLATLPTAMGVRGRYPVSASTGYQEQLPPVSSVVQNLVNMGTLNRNIQVGLNEFSSGFRLSRMLEGFLDGVLGLPTSAMLGSAEPRLKTSPGQSLMFTPLSVAEGSGSLSPLNINGLPPSFGQTVFGSRLTSAIRAPIANAVDLVTASAAAATVDRADMLTHGLLSSTGLTSLFGQMPAGLGGAAPDTVPADIRARIDRVLSSPGVLSELKAAVDAEARAAPGAFALSRALGRRLRGEGGVLTGAGVAGAGGDGGEAVDGILALQRVRAIIGGPEAAEELQQRVAQAAMYSANAGADLDNLLGLMSGFLTMPLDLAFKMVNTAFSMMQGMPGAMNQLSGGFGSLLNLRQVLQGLPVTWVFTQQQRAAVEQSVAAIDELLGKMERVADEPRLQQPAQLAQAFQRDLFNIGANVMKLNGTELIPRLVVGGKDLASVFGSMWAQPLGYVALDFGQMFAGGLGMATAGFVDVFSSGANAFAGMFESIFNNLGLNGVMAYATNAFLGVPNMFMDAIGLNTGVRGIQTALGNSLSQLNGMAAAGGAAAAAGGGAGLAGNLATPLSPPLGGQLPGQASTGYFEDLLLTSGDRSVDDLWEMAKVLRLQSLEDNVNKLTEALQGPTKQVTEGFGFALDDVRSAFTQSLGSINGVQLANLLDGSVSAPEVLMSAIGRIPIIGSIANAAARAVHTAGAEAAAANAAAVVAENTRPFGTVGLNLIPPPGPVFRNAPLLGAAGGNFRFFSAPGARRRLQEELAAGAGAAVAAEVPTAVPGEGAAAAKSGWRATHSAAGGPARSAAGSALASAATSAHSLFETLAAALADDAAPAPCVPAATAAAVRVLRAAALARDPRRLLQAAGVDEPLIRPLVTGEVAVPAVAGGGAAAANEARADDALCQMEQHTLAQFRAYVDHAAGLFRQVATAAAAGAVEEAAGLVGALGGGAPIGVPY